MVAAEAHNRFIIPLTYCVGLLTAIYPLAPELAWWRPALLPLLVIYWVLVMPEQISILMIWCFGCLLDILLGASLGQHSLGLMVIAYLCLLSYQRVRNYRLWHQSFFVFIFIGLYQLIGNWVHSLNGSAARSLVFLLPALSSALLWPLLWVLLERLRIGQRVS
ncbi:MAG: rod shape-determining protein MreD [Gammaproteobacteria bacterium]|uniref:rod shape-determining protein MreD n=1 Tax=Pseudomaricurvus alcaniphilus TaxID=1166482 RepID=UPI00140A5952|nr:rod shape-determining protein MreD [Pseudomaricurvus alcaniphilus]MBR9910522.1 rod shape-determining protein MreD [Gammaproteobacteria bacterium]NHN39679.1 rod shape-determining protein MreD [Pseudomaricurvus alcaniphilus]